MVLFWQDGPRLRALFGIPATGAVTFWVPLMVFAFLYGLSMDYEVFILSRIREEYDAGLSTDDAVVEGIGRTGRLVTSAALILFLAFVALASGPGHRPEDVRHRASASASCSTRPSCARCWCRRWCRCSALELVAPRLAWHESCASSRRTRTPSAPAATPTPTPSPSPSACDTPIRHAGPRGQTRTSP